VNFREEKFLLGVGQPQVRTPETVERVPGFQVALYSFLLLPERMVKEPLEHLPQPLWRRQQTDKEKTECRGSTGDLMRHLRAEVCGEGIGMTIFSGFATRHHGASKPAKFENCLASAVLYTS
jgi:hypothetical protein